MKVAI